jgi:hypothetical protein
MLAFSVATRASHEQISHIWSQIRPGMNRQYCPEGARKDAKGEEEKRILSSRFLGVLGVLAVLKPFPNLIRVCAR